MSGLPAGIDRLGPYGVVREVGSGAMGTVYLGRRGSEPVALKVIHAHLAREPRFFKRFEREAEAGSRVTHPNVVRTLDHGTAVAGDQPLCYLVMEHVEGRTLRELLFELGRVPEALLLEIARQTTAGLAAIHEAGIVHRDLKPENILITNDDRIRIMDLGVARIADAASALTLEGEFSGSLPYAAPEQFQNQVATFATDLYALGVVLYELGTGCNPFHLEALPAVIHAHLEAEPERADDRNPDLSVFLSEVLACLLAKQPKERFASASELLAVLEKGESSAWWSARRHRRLAADRDRPDVPVRRETRLHGRGTDRAALERCWQRARGGEGCVILLEGEAGIGKSRLVDAFLESSAIGDAHVLYGSYAPAGGLGAVSDAILGKFGTEGLEDALRPYIRGMPSLVDSFAASIRRDSGGGGAAPVQHDALHAVLVEFMRGLAAERPLLWIVEDLHFADASAHQRALSMARCVAGHRVCLILTSRPGFPDAVLAHLTRLADFRRLPLGRLGAREVILLLQDAFQSDLLADRLGARIALKSDGVPFFVFEVIRDLREKEFIKQLPGGRWIEARPVKALDVPSAVRDLIEARVSDLSKADRAILDVGAVQGFEFDPRRTAGALERSVVAVLQDLAEIERRVGVVRAVGRNYRFDHHQIQEVLYAQLPPRLREEYHAVLGDEIARAAADEPSDSLAAELCLHYVEGRRERDALPWLATALDQLQAAHLQEDLVHVGRRMLAVPECLVAHQRVEVLLRVAESTHVIGVPDVEEDLLLEAQRVASDMGDAALQSRAATGLGRHLQRRASFDAARSALETAIEQARAADALRLEIEALGVLGEVSYGRGRFEEAREHYERARALAESLGDRELQVGATGSLGTALSKLGRYDEAMDCFRAYLEAAQERHDLLAEATARGNLGLELTNTGRYEEATEQLEQQLSISAEIGHRYGEARANGILGAVALYRNDQQTARVHYERELEIAREIGDRRGAALATGNLGIVHLRQGRPEEARDCFTTWLEESVEIGNRSGEANAHGQLGFLCLQERDLQGARRHYEAWQRIEKETGNLQAEVTATGYLGAVFFEEGRFEEARACHERRLEVCTRLGDRRGVTHAHRNLAIAARAQGRLQECVAHALRELEVAREVGDVESEGHAHLTLSTAARLQGRHADAREHIDAYARYARDSGDRAKEGTSAGAAARLHADEGDVDAARGAFGRHLAIARERGDQRVVAEALLQLGSLEQDWGDEGEASGLLDEAARLGETLADPDLRVRIACRRAGASAERLADALGRFETYGDRMEHWDRMEMHVLLWRATRDPSHLAHARRLLDELLADAPDEHRPSMLDHVPLARTILGSASGG